jgi:hypothetical protein
MNKNEKEEKKENKNKEKGEEEKIDTNIMFLDIHPPVFI